MFTRTALLTAAFLSIASSGAHASWDIARSGTDCTVTQSASGLRFIQTADSLTISLGDRKLSWVEDGMQYDVTVSIDKSGWNGSMRGVNAGGRSSIDLQHPAAAFVTALRAGKAISLRIDGTTYGPYSLSGSSKALSDVYKCHKDAVAAATAPPAVTATETTGNQPKEWYLSGIVEWEADNIGTLYKGDDVSARMTKRDKLDGDSVVVVDVYKEGFGSTSFEIEAPHYLSGTIGLARLDRNQTEQFVFTNFTGGAHCCMEVRVIDFTGEQAKLIELGAFDTGFIRVEDYDSDGIQEFILPDERFRVFDAYAGTFPPDRVLGLNSGEIEDRTRWPGFRPHFERMYALQSEACGLEARDKPGACAGLAGTAAILGIHEETVGMMDFETVPEDEYFLPISICADEDCRSQREFDAFKDGLVHALGSWGYLGDRDASSTAAFPAFASRLAGKTFGDPNEQSELSCQWGATGFTRQEGLFGGDVYSISGYESSCLVASGLVVGNTAIVDAVCQGEGSPMWLEKRVYARDGDKMLVASSHGSLTSQTGVSELVTCD